MFNLTFRVFRVFRGSLITKFSIVLLFFSVHFLSCGHQNSPEGVAEEFLFRYFLELNQRGALELSTGLATEKLQDEIELTQSIRMQSDLELSKHRPFLDYELVNQNDKDGVVTFYYDVTIETSDGGNYGRQIVLTAVEAGGEWKIQNFDTFQK